MRRKSLTAAQPPTASAAVAVDAEARDAQGYGKYWALLARSKRALACAALLATVSVGCLAERASETELKAAVKAAAIESDGALGDGLVGQDVDVIDDDDADSVDNDSVEPVDTGPKADGDEVDAGDVNMVQPDGTELDATETDALVSNVTEPDTVDPDTIAPDTAEPDTADTDTQPNQVCTPGTKGCIGNVSSLCITDGSKLIPVDDCETLGQFCNDGVCVAKQQGFAASGSFGGLSASEGAGYRASELRFGVQRTCKGGFCSAGGLRP